MPKISKLYYEKLNKPFEISSVCRADLVSEGFDEEKVMKITDSEMEYIAGKIGDTNMDGYWIALREIVQQVLGDKEGFNE